MEDEGYQVATIKLRGKAGAVVLVFLLAVIAACIVNVRDVSPDDNKIAASLQPWIMSEHMRPHTDDIKKYMDSGDMKKAAEVGARISGSKANIESLKIAYPAIQHFTGKRDVVAKVTYSVTVEGVPGESKTEFYEMHKASFSDSWLCSGRVGKLYYYINLMDDDD